MGCEWEWVFVNLLKICFVITSPVTFVVGLFLIYDINTYQKIEKFLSRAYGSDKKIIKNLEHKRESFQIFLIKRRRLVGTICILNSLFAVFVICYALKNL